jgi:hypothetical protein
MNGRLSCTVNGRLAVPLKTSNTSDVDDSTAPTLHHLWSYFTAYQNTGRQIPVDHRFNILEGDEEGIVFQRLATHGTRYPLSSNVASSAIHKDVDTTKGSSDFFCNRRDHFLISKITMYGKHLHPMPGRNGLSHGFE